MPDAAEPVLRVEDLVVEFRQRGWRKPPFRAVDGVSFDIGAGETVGLVGESGSGKSTISRAILGLVKAKSGRIHFGSEDITDHSPSQRRTLAEDLSAVFQDPYGSLNPARTVGDSIAEPLAAARPTTRADQLATVRQLLQGVRLPADAGKKYPHSFSGGQRQRIAIARSLSLTPKLIICDEAVSALDVVTRAQILNLFVELRDQREAALLFIGHDLPIVGYMSKRVVVLYHGQVMERGTSSQTLRAPLHPYTRALLAAVPVVQPTRQRARREERLAAIRATTANAAAPPVDGCPFAPRCPHAADVCWNRVPLETAVAESTVHCHMYDVDSGHPEAGAVASVAEASRE